MIEIVKSVQHVTDIISDISKAFTEQSVSIEQVNRAIGQMDGITQENATLVDEAAVAAEAMQEQARVLARAVSVFKLLGEEVGATSMRTRQRSSKMLALAGPMNSRNR